MRGEYGRDQRGVVLILVLWVVVLLAVMATALGRTQRTQVAMTVNLVAAAEARALLDAGLHFMMAQLERRSRSFPDNPWPVDGRLHPWRFAGRTLWIGAEPEAARLDLNRASGGALHRLFLAAGIDEGRAQALRDAVLDWRDADGIARDHGAEDHDYLAAGRPAGAHDGHFASVDELLLVRGMTRELLRRLRPLLTVHAGRGTFDSGFAPREVRSSDPTPAGDGYTYRLHAEIDLEGGETLRRSMVIDIRHRTPRGYRVLAYHPHPSSSPPRVPAEEGGGRS